MISWAQVMIGVLSLAFTMPASVALAQGDADIPRTADGRPDLSGTYDIATLTPLQRPVALGDSLVLTEEQAAALGAEADSLEGIFNIPDERNEDRAGPFVVRGQATGHPLAGTQHSAMRGKKRMAVDQGNRLAADQDHAFDRGIGFGGDDRPTDCVGVEDLANDVGELALPVGQAQ